MSLKGRFITLEGIDGAGKSTYLPWIINFLENQGINVIATREPGGTSIGENLRELLLHEKMEAETEALLLFAARFEHVHNLICPALSDGKWVICDRFSDSTYAYQGSGRKISIDHIKRIEKFFKINLKPDMTWFFDLPIELANFRLINDTKKDLDRFEVEKLDFFKCVRDGYLNQVKKNPKRINLINATQSENLIKSILKVDLMKLISESL